LFAHSFGYNGSGIDIDISGVDADPASLGA